MSISSGTKALRTVFNIARDCSCGPKLTVPLIERHYRDPTFTKTKFSIIMQSSSPACSPDPMLKLLFIQLAIRWIFKRETLQV